MTGTRTKVRPRKRHIEKATLQKQQQQQEVPKEINVSNISLGGRTKHHYQQWKSITQDPFVLSCILGCKINFIQTPIQTPPSLQLKFNSLEKAALNEKISELLKDGVITKCTLEEGDYLNNVFLREVKGSNGKATKYRIILQYENSQQTICRKN